MGAGCCKSNEDATDHRSVVYGPTGSQGSEELHRVVNQRDSLTVRNIRRHLEGSDPLMNHTFSDAGTPATIPVTSDNAFESRLLQDTAGGGGCVAASILRCSRQRQSLSNGSRFSLRGSADGFVSPSSHFSVSMDSLGGRTLAASELPSEPSSPTTSFQKPLSWGKLLSLDRDYRNATLQGDFFTLGREPHCTYQFKNKLVSSTHFHIHVLDHAQSLVEIEDVSHNGTQVNDRRIEGRRQRLKHGDKISFPVLDSSGRKTFFAGFLFQLASRVSGDLEGAPRYTLSNELGKGGNATVYQALTHEGSIIAVKRFPTTSQMHDAIQLTSLQQEIKMLSAYQHENLVQYLGTAEGRNYFDVLLEYVPGGSVKSILSRFGPLNEVTIRNYLLQTLTGLRFLHENRVLHGDIKAANILVTAKGQCKLADFGGSSKVLDNEALLNSCYRGTALWMAPEVVREKKFSLSADIWSLGCTFIEMASGSIPWAERSLEGPMVIINFLRRTSEPPQLNAKHKLSDKAVDFCMNACLQLDQTQRLTAQELLLHSFITSQPPRIEVDHSAEFSQSHVLEMETHSSITSSCVTPPPDYPSGL
eukprot:Sspe_Gene.101612::Locus_76211_Transcript_1_1_Confidence_1.000_Length_1827::g.101612::m.101612